MKFLYPLVCAFALTSCVAVRFPNEIKVNVAFPENISEENMTRIIDKIPPTLGKRKVQTRVEAVTHGGTTTKEEQREESLQKE